MSSETRNLGSKSLYQRKPRSSGVTMTTSGPAKSVTIELPPELHRRFKAKTALDGITMQAAVSAFVEQYVEGFGGA